MEKELSFSTSFLMTGAALFFDGLQILVGWVPIIGQIISPIIGFFALITFWFWFKIHGISFSKKKRAATIGAGAIIELIPILNLLPMWTLAVLRIISTNKLKNGGATKQTHNQKPPVSV